MNQNRKRLFQRNIWSIEHEQLKQLITFCAEPRPRRRHPATSLLHVFMQCSAASRWSNVPFGNCRHIKYSDRHDLHEIQVLLQSKTIRSIEPAQGQCDQIWTGHNQSDQMRSNRLNWDQTRLQVSGESGTLKSSQQSKRRRKSELSDLKQRSQSKRRALPVSTKRARFTRGCMETKLPARRRRLQAEESLTLVHLSCF